MIPEEQQPILGRAALGLDLTLKVYRDNSRFLCVTGGRELRRALNRFPVALKRQLQEQASEAFLARPGQGVAAVYFGNRASLSRFALAWFLGFDGEQENGWAFMEAMPRHSLAEAGLHLCLQDNLGDA